MFACHIAWVLEHDRVHDGAVAEDEERRQHPGEDLGEGLLEQAFAVLLLFFTLGHVHLEDGHNQTQTDGGSDRQRRRGRERGRDEPVPHDLDRPPVEQHERDEHHEAEDQRSDGIRQFTIVASRAGHNGSFLSYLGTVPLTDMSVCIPITHKMRFCVCDYRSKISPRASLLVKKLFWSNLTKDGNIVAYYCVYVNDALANYRSLKVEYSISNRKLLYL